MEFLMILGFYALAYAIFGGVSVGGGGGDAADDWGNQDGSTNVTNHGPNHPWRDEE